MLRWIVPQARPVAVSVIVAPRDAGLSAAPHFDRDGSCCDARIERGAHAEDLRREWTRGDAVGRRHLGEHRSPGVVGEDHAFAQCDVAE